MPEGPAALHLYLRCISGFMNDAARPSPTALPALSFGDFAPELCDGNRAVPRMGKLAVVKPPPHDLLGGAAVVGVHPHFSSDNAGVPRSKHDLFRSTMTTGTLWVICVNLFAPFAA